MRMPEKNIEELFLKIFKFVILSVMGLALIAIPLLLASAAFQFLQSPNEPSPARKAPIKENGIHLDNLKQWLIEQEKAKGAEPVSRRPVAMSQTTVEFLSEAQTLYECSLRFAQAVGAEIPGSADNNEKSKQTIDLRSRLDYFARIQEWRGEPWVKAVVAFGCSAMSDSDVIAMKRDGKIPLILGPLINFHLMAWDKVEIEKRQFEQAELNRVQLERSAETARVAVAKANGVAQFIAALASFGVFMALAIYLIFSKVETNLRSIDEAIRLGARPPA